MGDLNGDRSAEARGLDRTSEVCLTASGRAWGLDGGRSGGHRDWAGADGSRRRTLSLDNERHQSGDSGKPWRGLAPQPQPWLSIHTGGYTSSTIQVTVGASSSAISWSTSMFMGAEASNTLPS